LLFFFFRIITLQITESYVQEAFMLLQKSIIRVEHDDIDLENEAEDDSKDSDNVEMDVDMADNGSLMSDAAPAKKRILFEKYQNIVDMVTMKLRSVQSASTNDNDDVDDKDIGMKRNDLIDWYLEEKEDELGGEDELEEEKLIISLVLKRMVTVDHHSFYAHAQRTLPRFLILADRL
jgi:DNA replication licensing factor MCM6